MHVTKMHGARNDFVVVDVRTHRLADAPGFARWICDRREAVGADGLILLEPSSIGKVRMRTFNADGSEAEMCGNGIRCAARWLDEAGEGDRADFETEAGIVRTEIAAREPEYLVRVSMGEPKIGTVALDGAVEAFVDVGNPHVVLVRDDVEAIDLERLAQRFQDNSRFPTGTNVHVMAQAGPNSLRVRHWERGAGLTPACGTGIVACAAVAIRRQIANSPVEVFVPGGRLVVDWTGSGAAGLTGPAVRVFDTDVEGGDGALS
jgi:diaminopimelate epimerase